MANWAQKKQFKLIYLLPVVLAVLIGAAFLVWRLFLGPADFLQLQVGLPGSATQAGASYQGDAKIADLLEDRCLDLLLNEGTGMLAMSYRQLDRYDLWPAEQSGTILAADQLLYGQYLLEQNRKSDFLAWWKSFESTFQLENGQFQSGIQPADVLADDAWRVNLSALRLLAQSCTVWPDQARQTTLLELSDQLLIQSGSVIGSDYAAVVPTLAPIQDFAATPTPKPSVSPQAVSGASVDVIRLASLDLFTMQQLAQLDSGWQTLYNKYREVVVAGFVSDELPLYAFGFAEASGAYVNYSGVTPYLDTYESLLTLLHLCEVGQQNTRSINWLRDQLLNKRAIYESYHIAQGQPADENECIAGYGIAARIARITGDQALYDAAVDRLLWHRATSQTSDVRGAVFREAADELIYIFAVDNAWALLGMR